MSRAYKVKVRYLEGFLKEIGKKIEIFTCLVSKEQDDRKKPTLRRICILNLEDYSMEMLEESVKLYNDHPVIDWKLDIFRRLGTPSVVKCEEIDEIIGVLKKLKEGYTYLRHT
ncbi:MAG: hypothetical protein GXO10_01705 [Crenarchaeota archaeon]|nr:hypothetical protein [Thermoproteota archaeon]